jgi:hypothetical protein
MPFWKLPKAGVTTRRALLRLLTTIDIQQDILKPSSSRPTAETQPTILPNDEASRFEARSPSATGCDACLGALLAHAGHVYDRRTPPQTAGALNILRTTASPRALRSVKLRAKGLVERNFHLPALPTPAGGLSSALSFSARERVYARSPPGCYSFSPNNKLQNERLSQLDRKLCQRIVRL